MKYTPDNIEELPTNSVFVFGSNMQGRHGKGASVIAQRIFGAKRGLGKGLSPRPVRHGVWSYAFPTKHHPTNKPEDRFTLSEIGHEFMDLLNCVESNPRLEFYLTKVGCGLSCYEPERIGKLFFHVVGGSHNLEKGYPNLAIPMEFALEFSH